MEETEEQAAAGGTYSHSSLSFKGHWKPKGLYPFQNSVALWLGVIKLAAYDVPTLPFWFIHIFVLSFSSGVGREQPDTSFLCPGLPGSKDRQCQHCEPRFACCAKEKTDAAGFAFVRSLFPKGSSWLIVDLLEAKIVIPGFMGRTRPVTAMQHHFTERGVLCPPLLTPLWLSLCHQPGGQVALREIRYCRFSITSAPLFWCSRGFTCFMSPLLEWMGTGFSSHPCSPWSLLCFPPSFAIADTFKWREVTTGVIRGFITQININFRSRDFSEE